eukprot:symbB.v1.2.011044.t1/scaffold734.1/size167996/3
MRPAEYAAAGKPWNHATGLGKCSAELMLAKTAGHKLPAMTRHREDGNTDQLNKRVIIDGEEGMWVLEGDEVVAVNGTNVEGKSLDEVGPLVKNSEGIILERYGIIRIRITFL